MIVVKGIGQAEATIDGRYWSFHANLTFQLWPYASKFQVFPDYNKVSFSPPKSFGHCTIDYEESILRGMCENDLKIQVD